MASRKIAVMTEDGAGFLQETNSSFGRTSYRISGNGFEGWYSANQIFSELDDDETTTDLNFDIDTDNNSEGEDGSSVIQPDEGDDDPMGLEEGTELPWNPEPTEEWGTGSDDGELTQLPDGGEISLTPSSSTKGSDFSEDPESSTKVFGKIGGINWDSAEHGTIGQHHEIYVSSSPHDTSWVIGDKNGNPVHQNSHGNRNGMTDQDHDHALNLMSEDADEVEQGALAKGRHSFKTPRKAFMEYIALVQSDSMVREAAWADVRKKARRMLNGGDVMVVSNTSREIVAKVDGDHGRYDTSVHRKNAFGQGVTYWDCDCEWGQHAYKRARTFIGRMCSHSLATYWAMQAKQAPASTKRRIDNKTERHTLGSNEGNVEIANYPKNESLASRQAGLMIWDDDLHKVMKQMFPATAPGGGMGMPGDPGSAGMSPMSADPAGVPDGLGNDPGLDPNQMGDPNGSGLQPGGATPEFVRSTNGPTQADPVNTPTGTPLTASIFDQYMSGKTAEFTNGNPNNDFEKWGEPNSEGAETFNTVQELDKENKPEENVYDEFYGRSSNVLAYSFAEDRDDDGEDGEEPRSWSHNKSYDDDSEGENNDSLHDGHDHEYRHDYIRSNLSALGDPSITDPQPGQDINTPAVAESQLPVVPRAQQQGGMQGYSKVAGIDGEDHNPYENYDSDPSDYVRHSAPRSPNFNGHADPWQEQEEKDPGGIATNFPKRNVSRHQFSDMQTDPALDPANGPQDPNAQPMQPGQMGQPGVNQAPVLGSPQAGPMPTPVASPRVQQASFNTFADNDDSSDNSWQKDSKPADHDEDDDYDDDDEDYHNNEEDHDGKTSSRHDDEDDVYSSQSVENIRQAERFNEQADDVVAQFQRTAGKNFTFSEQQDLINENKSGSARQMADLNLTNSFYE